MEKLNKLEQVAYVIFKNKDYPIFEMVSNFNTLHIVYNLEVEQELIKKIKLLTDISFNLGYIQGSETTSVYGLMVLF